VVLSGTALPTSGSRADARVRGVDDRLARPGDRDGNYVRPRIRAVECLFHRTRRRSVLVPTDVVLSAELGEKHSMMTWLNIDTATIVMAWCRFPNVATPVGNASVTPADSCVYVDEYI
jgi:hypothetical protein